jgi:hypothetical protein
MTGVDRYTDLLTRRVLLARPAARLLFLGLARAAILLPFLREAVIARAGMLDTRYRASALLRGRGRWLGRRAPDGDLVDADGAKGRLLDLAGEDAALLLFDDGRLPGWNAAAIEAALGSVPHLRVARLRRPGLPSPLAPAEARSYQIVDGRLWNAWQATGQLAALVRPDGFVGWMARAPGARSSLSPAALRAGVAAALGAPAAAGGINRAAQPGSPAGPASARRARSA